MSEAYPGYDDCAGSLGPCDRLAALRSCLEETEDVKNALRARVAELEAERDALRAEALVLGTLVDLATPIDQPPVDLAPLTSAAAERVKAMERVLRSVVDIRNFIKGSHDSGYVEVRLTVDEFQAALAALDVKGEE